MSFNIFTETNDATLKEVQSGRQLKGFLFFPHWLYRNDKRWKPPHLPSVKKYLDPRQNPFFSDGDFKLFLVYKDRRIAGRVAVFGNRRELSENIQVMRFGFLDFINDAEVTGLLMKAVEDSAAELGADTILGCSGFTLDWIDGMVQIHEKNTAHPFYKPEYFFRQLDKLGYQKQITGNLMRLTGKTELAGKSSPKQDSEQSYDRFPDYIMKLSAEEKTFLREISLGGFSKFEVLQSEGNELFLTDCYYNSKNYQSNHFNFSSGFFKRLTGRKSDKLLRKTDFRLPMSLPPQTLNVLLMKIRESHHADIYAESFSIKEWSQLPDDINIEVIGNFWQFLKKNPG